MESWLPRIEAEHRFEVARTSTKFNLEVSLLRPYHVTEGVWCILPLHFSSSVPLEAEAPFNTGYELVCYQTVSGSDKPLALFYINKADFDSAGRTVIFGDQHRPLLLNKVSDRIYFHLRTLSGQPVQLAKGGQILLGVALLQLR